MNAMGRAPVRPLRLGHKRSRAEEGPSAFGHEVHLIGVRARSPVLLTGLVIDLADLYQVRARIPLRTLRTTIAASSLRNAWNFRSLAAVLLRRNQYARGPSLYEALPHEKRRVVQGL